MVDAADFDWLNQYTWHLIDGHAGQATSPAGPGPRYVELSGSAHAHCFAGATLTVIHIGRVA